MESRDRRHVFQERLRQSGVGESSTTGAVPVWGKWRECRCSVVAAAWTGPAAAWTGPDRPGSNIRHVLLLQFAGLPPSRSPERVACRYALVIDCAVQPSLLPQLNPSGGQRVRRRERDDAGTARYASTVCQQQQAHHSRRLRRIRPSQPPPNPHFLLPNACLCLQPLSYLLLA